MRKRNKDEGWMSCHKDKRKTREYSPHQLVVTAWALSSQSEGPLCSARVWPACCSWRAGRRRAAWRRGSPGWVRRHCGTDTGWRSRHTRRQAGPATRVAWVHVSGGHCPATCPWSLWTRASDARHAPPLTMGCHVTRGRVIRPARWGIVTTSSFSLPEIFSSLLCNSFRKKRKPIAEFHWDTTFFSQLNLSDKIKNLKLSNGILILKFQKII